MNSFLDEMRKRKRMKLTKKQIFFHYFFVPVFLILGFLIYFLYESLSTQPDKIISTGILVTTGLIALFYFIRQWRSLNFKEYQLEISQPDFELEMQKLAKTQNWIPEYITDNWLIYSTAFKWYNWGTVIYLVRNENSVMIRSICELYNRPSTLSFGVNRQNMKAFANHFENVK